MRSGYVDPIQEQRSKLSRHVVKKQKEKDTVRISELRFIKWLQIRKFLRVTDWSKKRTSARESARRLRQMENGQICIDQLASSPEDLRKYWRYRYHPFYQKLIPDYKGNLIPSFVKTE